MTVCKNCGKQYNENLNFCPNCGTPNHERSQKSDQETCDTVLANPGNFGSNLNSRDSFSPRNILPGSMIDNRYEVKEKIGSGGFGTVYKVWDNDADCYKALKMIHNEYYDDKEVIADLKKEAKTLMKILSNHVVRVWDIHLHGDLKYIDMEYIDGKDLVDFKLDYADKKVHERIVYKIALQLAIGMKEIHKTNVIHRDLKPQNIMLTKNGKIKIMDFGLAETFQLSQSRINESSRSGTYPYMSPEQLKGSDLGKESDIWAYGIILYELLTGKRMYSGNSYADILTQIQVKDFQHISYVSDKLNNLIDACLQTNYKDRIRSFNDVIKFLVKKDAADFGKKLPHKKSADTKSSTNKNSYIEKRYSKDVSKIAKNIENDILNNAFPDKKSRTRYDKILLYIAIIAAFSFLIYFGINFTKGNSAKFHRNAMKAEMKDFALDIVQCIHTPVNYGGCGNELASDDAETIKIYLGWYSGNQRTDIAWYELYLKADVVQVIGEGKVIGLNGKDPVKILMEVDTWKSPPYSFKTLN